MRQVASGVAVPHFAVIKCIRRQAPIVLSEAVFYGAGVEKARAAPVDLGSHGIRDIIDRQAAFRYGAGSSKFATGLIIFFLLCINFLLRIA